jgi:hypothetical protein
MIHNLGGSSLIMDMTPVRESSEKKTANVGVCSLRSKSHGKSRR